MKTRLLAAVLLMLSLGGCFYGPGGGYGYRGDGDRGHGDYRGDRGDRESHGEWRH